ncbi:YhcN/YlaJ family sporulation lipoprotein [Ornithinibacillus halotolerans]|uniref:YhcN/YlaJ family sporulation lipoprotein n=1 Tax=Ornithinibacillus halotolerans TaxID=1274357 RepID=UPI001E5C26FA|nr:YhcN/YlaJ family sporulation lipoprotein [Ornithinibacillus halotolerans]
MLKQILSILFLTIFIVGCTNTDNSSSNDYQIPTDVNPNNESNIENMSNENPKVGYVNYTRDQLNQENEQNHAVTIDYSQMADMIAKIILKNEGFNRVATLVTDQEVLIAYDRDDALDRVIAADIASKTAVSVMPGFYDVYVSDNEMLINDIQSLHRSSPSNRDYDNTLEQIINRMKETPQGIKHKEDLTD